ncbi:CDP-glycerol glycerophosphotransferase family protein [Schwartzia succinivorans]|uniref:CDP-Glycerol:Poly(Glycerophosphate) glycerophosphotransferase n=1 Tax=Schwartzia succinivorans DSM 10502 TaxID=1123243 RepID=A0A1M4XMJ3_9FIRM|nr:CDP-glycerol glycerophosphotransferase family protein [Schwartzia succinivorans]SHE94616.1 CDP-Glycerol:Poly(glycerophosphate) glycerophosphotransferase [Schwartzia succinivorans DSM 10502]
MRLYIDPGTGSMLFTILVGLIGAAVFSIRMFWVKVRFFFSGGKKVKMDGARIPLVIFSDDKRYWSIFEPICRELNHRGQEVVYMTASADDPALNTEYEYVKAEFIGEGNRAFAKLNFLQADIVLSTTPGLDVYQWRRSPEVHYYVHILHMPNDATLYRMFGLDYYDAVLLSGDFQVQQIRELEKLRELPPKELVKVGIPYMDEMKKRLISAPILAEHERTVLLAPSWGPEAIFSKIGDEILKILLSTGWHIIVRPHPQSFTSEKELMDNLMEEYPPSEQLEWNRDNDNFEVLRRSDILISDFSGVIFDFTMIYNKPVIYTAGELDTSVYDAWWLDTPVWTTTVLPKLGRELSKENLNNLKEIIESCLTDDLYSKGRDEVRKEAWAYPDEGAVRVVDYLTELQKRLLESGNDNVL